MLLRLICLLVVALPSSLVQAQSFDSPRLNKIEMQIVDMQVKIEAHDLQIVTNTAAIENLKSTSLGVVAPEPKPGATPVVRSVPRYSAPVVTYSAPVVETPVPAPAPVVTYSAPVVETPAAVVTYSTPVVAYSKPVVKYSRPKTTVTYSQPQPVVRYTKPVPVSRTRPTLRARLFGGGNTNAASCYIDANGNQVCPY